MVHEYSELRQPGAQGQNSPSSVEGEPLPDGTGSGQPVGQQDWQDINDTYEYLPNQVMNVSIAPCLGVLPAQPPAWT